MKRFCSTNL